MFLIALEVIMFSTMIIFAVLWIVNHDGGYEPWTIICGAIAAGLELFRGFQNRSAGKTKPNSNSTDNPYDSQHETTTTQTAFRSMDTPADGIPHALTRPPFLPEVFLGRTEELQTIKDKLFTGNHMLLLGDCVSNTF